VLYLQLCCDEGGSLASILKDFILLNTDYSLLLPTELPTGLLALFYDVYEGFAREYAEGWPWFVILPMHLLARSGLRSSTNTFSSLWEGCCSFFVEILVFY
jgi:hypothetical protein